MSMSQAIGCASAACSMLIVSFLGFTMGNDITSTDCITEGKSVCRHVEALEFELVD